MTSIGGTIRIGEAQATAAATSRRQRGGMWWFWVLIFVLVIGIGLLGLWLSGLAGINPTIGWLVGGLTGLLVYLRLSKGLVVWRYRRTQGDKGVPLEVAIRWQITADELVYEIGDVVSRAKWRVVTEVFHDKGWWIVMVQGAPWFAADRFFSGETEQRAFIREVLSHMSDEARARSQEAVKFASA